MTPLVYGAIGLALLASLPANALAGELTIRDSSGREIGTVERSPAGTGLAIIRGQDGRVLGTVEDPEARQRAGREHYESVLRSIAPARPDDARDAGQRR